MKKKVLIEKLKKIVEKSDATPEYDRNDYKTGHINSDTLTEVREDIQSIINVLVLSV